ncbi:DivIVA domain-containing protein [Streptosporangium canum]|uniref:DivIVA domain-containing protein n=1 Tax=Streptosporangium canum TaxID=324952 RepID=UPI00341A9D98
MSVMQIGSNVNSRDRLLTPHDVRNKVFPTVRLREGYDLAEVDNFLGEVEFTLSEVLWENEQLNARLLAASRTPQQILSSASDNATRIVTRAQQSADAAITQAEQEAKVILAEARNLAETIEREALDRAAALERDAQEKHRQTAEALDNAYAAQQRMIDDLHDLVHHQGSRVKETLDGQVGQLQSLLQGVKERGGPLVALLHPQPAAPFTADEQLPVAGQQPMPTQQTSRSAGARTSAPLDGLLTDDS